MSDGVAPHGVVRRVSSGLAVLAMAGAAVGTVVAPAVLVVVGATAAGASVPQGAPSGTAYLPATPSLATIASPAACATTADACAPWNTSQGTSTATPYYSSTTAAQTYVLPTYTPDGPTTSVGGVTEPNVGVASTTATGTGAAPYPAGVVGTPGPLDDYCGPGTHAAEGSRTSVSRQPAGSTLPLSPAYFPHIVKNPTGSLTGYFDYRPKTGDEALVAATATATGEHWTYAGEALEQNPDYCPTADVNDDGEGHANLVTVGGTEYLYTLPRAAGDSSGVGLVVHRVDPSPAHPLGTGATALPRDEKTGVDPDAFATGAVTVRLTHVSGHAVTVTTTGTAHSPEQLVTGGFVDATVGAVATDVFTCTVTLGAATLTTCKTAVTGKTVTVTPGNLVEQVIGFTSKKFTIPAGPNKTVGTGGLPKITVVTTVTGSTAGFTNRLTGTTVNTNAPNRIYVDGVAVYCTQGSTNPTTTVTGCTTGAGGSSFSAPAHSPILSDPIVPKSAYKASSGDGMTNGLVAPDGIVGTLPRYPGAPGGSTVVMYTEKELNYYVAGVMAKTSKLTFSSTTAFSVAFTPGPYFPGDMPATISAAHPVTVSMGDTTTKSIIPVTCTGVAATATAKHPEKLTGCLAPAADNGNTTVKSTTWIGAPGATTVPYSTLKLTGEGKTTPEKLDKNNEDLTVLRVAYTTTGVVFRTTGLAGTGVVSTTGVTAAPGATYTSINDAASNADPTSTGAVDLNKYAKAGTADATEMRYVGSAGTVLTVDGTIDLFLSGAWAADGDSDAFNQIFFSQSKTGEVWSVPKTVVSTDYTFAASQRALTPSSPTYHKRLTIGAYYEGRAYGPSVVADTAAGRTLTMVFAGYRTPKGSSTAGKVYGTGYGGTGTWTVGKTTPNLYRSILTTTLDGFYTTSTSLSVTPPEPQVGQTVTLTATVTSVEQATGAVTIAGTGFSCTPTLDGSSPDEASCNTAFTAAAHLHLTASYAGDADFGASRSTAATVAVVPDTTTTTVGLTPATPAYAGVPVKLVATVAADAPGVSTPAGTVTVDVTGHPVCTTTLQVQDGADEVVCPTGFAAAGTFHVVATYAGNGTDRASTGTAAVVVAKDPTTTVVSESAPSATYGEEHTVSFSAAVTAAYGEAVPGTGEVTIRVGTASCTATLTPGADAGSCRITADSLPAGGPYSVDATYAGTGTLGTSTSTNQVTFSVGTARVRAAVSGTTTYGSSAVALHATSEPSGVSFGGTLVCTDVEFHTSISGLTAGTYTITGSSCSGLTTPVDYSISTYQGVVDGFTVAKDSTTTTVTESEPSALYDMTQTTLFTVRVAAHNGEAVPDTQTAVVHVGPATCVVLLADGTGSCSITWGELAPASSYPVSASYFGDADLQASATNGHLTFAVTTAPITIFVTGTSTYGSGTAHVYSYTRSPGIGGITGTLTCSGLTTGQPLVGNSLTAGTYTVTGTSCSGLVPPATGGFTLRYVGKPGGFTIKQDPTTTSVSELESAETFLKVGTATFGVEVTPANGVPAPSTQKVTIFVGPATCTAVLHAGIGECSLPPDTASDLNAGLTYPVSAVYPGDTDLAVSPSSNEVTFTSTYTPLTVLVTGTATYGSPHVSLRFTVTPPEATVGTLACTGVTGGSPIGTLPAGAYTVTGASCTGLSALQTYRFRVAGYVGVHGGFTVAKDSTTTAVSESEGSAPYPGEHTAVFTVTVTTGNGETVPTGEKATVHVGVASCVAVVTAGTGHCSLTAGKLGVGGPYPVSASYGGDADLTASTSANPVSFSVTSGSLDVAVSGSDAYGSTHPSFTALPALAVSLSGTLTCTRVLPTTPIVSVPPLPVGTYSVEGSTCSGLSAAGYTLVYSGAPTGFGVTPDTTSTTVSGPATSTYAAEATALFTVKVSTHDGEAVPNGESAALSVGSTSCTAVLTAGIGTCRIAAVLPVGGPYAVSATYDGDKNLVGSTSTAKVTFTVVTSATPSCSKYAGANLRGVNLAGDNLAGCTITGANLQTANLSGTNLKGANLEGSNLSGADLKGSDLQGAALQGVNLKGGVLAYADLAGANLEGDNLSSLNGTGADFAGAAMQGVNLSGADLAGADLAKADLQGSNLSGADLAGADLAKADLQGSNLSGADLAGADLTGANLSGANLKGAVY